MRNVIFIIHVTETELQYFHARELEHVTQLFYFRCDHAKIFCPDRKVIAQALFWMARKQIFAGTFYPLAIDCSLFLGGYGPVSLKSAEMVDTQIVCEGQLTADPGRSTSGSRSPCGNPSHGADCPTVVR